MIVRNRLKLQFNYLFRILSFLYKRLKFKIILFSQRSKKKERKRFWKKYSYTNLFSPILRAFARCVLRGDDGATIRRELEKLRVAFRRAAARKSAESLKREKKKNKKNSLARRRAVILKSFSEFISKWPL